MFRHSDLGFWKKLCKNIYKLCKLCKFRVCSQPCSKAKWRINWINRHFLTTNNINCSTGKTRFKKRKEIFRRQESYLSTNGQQVKSCYLGQFWIEICLYQQKCWKIRSLFDHLFFFNSYIINQLSLKFCYRFAHVLHKFCFKRDLVSILTFIKVVVYNLYNTSNTHTYVFEIWAARYRISWKTIVPSFKTKQSNYMFGKMTKQ